MARKWEFWRWFPNKREANEYVEEKNKSDQYHEYKRGKEKDGRIEVLIREK